MVKQGGEVVSGLRLAYVSRRRRVETYLSFSSAQKEAEKAFVTSRFLPGEKCVSCLI